MDRDIDKDSSEGVSSSDNLMCVEQGGNSIDVFDGASHVGHSAKTADAPMDGSVCTKLVFALRDIDQAVWTGGNLDHLGPGFSCARKEPERNRE